MPTPKTTFPPNKNAKELGIDTTRKFVVVNADRFEAAKGFGNDTIITLFADDNSSCPKFCNAKGDKIFLYWSQLAYAYADEVEVEEPHFYEESSVGVTRRGENGTDESPYVPCFGDRVSLKGVILKVNKGSRACHISINSNPDIIVNFSALTLLSRKSPRKITRAELEKLVGEAFEIVEE